MLLDPQAKALLDKAAAANVPGPDQVPAPQARDLYKRSRLPLQPPKPEMALVRDFTIDDGHGAVTLREFRPLTSNATPLPALLYFHGGGWVIGDIETHDTLCRQLADGSGAVVFSVNYSKSPEYRFPVAVDECTAATRYVSDQSDSLGIDASRIGVGGDSAGANLATVVALTLRGQLNKPLVCQLLIYPVTDLRLSKDSIERYAVGYGLTTAAMRYFRDAYLRDSSDQDDFRASPLLASDLSKLPPALVLTAGFDPLRDEGRAYADALSAAGNQVQYVCFERQIHGFIIMGGIIDEANTAVAMCVDYVRTRFK